jgi:hypothetical protein
MRNTEHLLGIKKKKSTDMRNTEGLLRIKKKYTTI